MKLENTLRALELPLQGTNAVLPHISVSEIISYRALGDVQTSEPVDWVLGMTNWFGFQVPVISFERLVGDEFVVPARKAKIAICNLLDSQLEYPAVGIVVQEIPRLLLIDSEDQLTRAASHNDHSLVLAAQYRERPVWIPDLGKLGVRLNELLHREGLFV